MYGMRGSAGRMFPASSASTFWAGARSVIDEDESLVVLPFGSEVRSTFSPALTEVVDGGTRSR